MVLRADAPRAPDHASTHQRRWVLVYMTPRRRAADTGQVLHTFASGPGVTILAGRFEGIDERAIEDSGGLSAAVDLPADTRR